jgi:hypothetical protein
VKSCVERQTVKGTIITLPCDGSRLATPIDRSPTLDRLRAAVRVRDIEVVPRFDTIEHAGMIVPCVAFCEEDAKLKRLPINKDATILWDAALLHAGYPGLLKAGGQISDNLCGQVAAVFGNPEFMRALSSRLDRDPSKPS